MKKLSKQLKKKGTDMFQVYENENFYIYATFIKNENCFFNSFEIFTKKINKPWKYNNEESERYPSDEDFGTWAWSCSNNNSLFRILREKYQKDDQEIKEIISVVYKEAENIENLVDDKAKSAHFSY